MQLCVEKKLCRHCSSQSTSSMPGMHSLNDTEVQDALLHMTGDCAWREVTFHLLAVLES